MKSLLRYLGSYKKESILAPLFKLLEALFELFVPLVMARIIDIGIKNGDIGYILKMGGLLILLGIIGLVCSLTAQYFAAKAAVGFGTALRHDLFQHIQSLSYSEVDTVGTSTLITRMTSDINQVQAGVNLFLRLFMRSPFIVFGAMIMAFTIDWKAAMIFVITIPALSVVVFGIMLVSIPMYRKVQSRLDRVTQLTRENLVGARVIRAFNRQKDERENFTEANALLMKVQVFVGKITALLNPVTYIIINVAIVVLLWVGANQVNNGIILQGAVVALVNYMSQILVELVKLANLIINITKSLACANRIQNVMELKPSLTEYSTTEVKETNSENYIEFDHVTFAYQNAKEPSLTDISFKVKKGQTIGIIGGTGSGKSSLINLIPRFYDATKGKITVDGTDIKRYPLNQIRTMVGIVPQKAVLFKGTIAENMRFVFHRRQRGFHKGGKRFRAVRIREQTDHMHLFRRAQLHTRHHGNARRLPRFLGGTAVPGGVMIRQGNDVKAHKRSHIHQVIGRHIAVAAGGQAGVDVQIVIVVHFTLSAAHKF